VINHVLATLDNDPTIPDDIIWPDFTARSIEADEASIRSAIIGVNLSRENRIARCLQLVNLLAESPLVSYLTSVDPRITYTKESIQNRLGVSGTVVMYTGTAITPPRLNLVLTASTPDIASYAVICTDGTHATIQDDLGASLASTFTFSGGQSSQISAPNQSAYVILSGATPAAGDRWSVSYQKPGASWVQQAMVRLARVNPKPIMSHTLQVWYDRSPVGLDKLAAVVAALGTAG
jgi:hypothetical protein